jgi:hypothetical protein
MARNFAGTGDSIGCAIGGCNLGYGTFAAILTRPVDTALTAVIGVQTSGSTNRMRLQINATDELRMTHGSAVDSPTIRVLAADGWVFVAAGKGTGTTTPRFHEYVYSTNTWIHEDGGATSADATVPGSDGFVRLGQNAGAAQSLQGDLLIAGYYAGTLTDAQIESMAFSLSAWLSAPNLAGLWLLDQSLTTQNVIDLTGNGANQTTLVGTAVATNHPPVFTRGARVSYSRAQAAAAGGVTRHMMHYRRLRAS